MFTVRTRKFKQNPLLGRKQFVVDVIHPGQANVSKADVTEKLKAMYKVKDSKCISVFGFHTTFGGGRSHGFGLVYESLDAAKKFEPAYRLKRVEVEKPRRTRVRAKMPRRQYKKMLGEVKKRRGKKKTEIIKNPPAV